ncbi:MAG TPA: ATP-binding protein, partial [Anaerolineae bacterium]|nr:ATP-binding protein [Anaerolineae bacterium]
FMITIPHELPQLLTYRTPLELVFRNLLQNAIKHHHRPHGQIQVTARDLGAYIEFTVQDDGPGIDPAYHERVFQLFQTLRPRDEVEGSGIGLAIVKKTVETQGGTISLSSTAGQGAMFRFTWPKKPSL